MMDPRNRVFVNPLTNAEPTVYRGDDDGELDLPEYQATEEIPVADSSPVEFIEKELEQYEKNLSDERTRAQRWQGQERWQGRENEEMRLINIIHANTFVKKLNKAGIRTGFDTVEKEFCRIWLNDYPRVGRIGVNARIPDAATGKMVESFITTIQFPLGPEWSIMRFNDYNVPTAEKYRGWRTALLALIIKNIITEEEAHKAFGEPMLGPASLFYRKQLFNHRSQRIGLTI